MGCKSGKRKGASVVKAVGVEKISDDSSSFALVAKISSFNHSTALALRFSYGQCSRVSLIKARRTWLEGWECRSSDVRM